MEQRPLRLGDILDDYCPRERRVTNHAVVAMIEEDVRQTRCTTCDAEHAYKGGKAPRRRAKKESPAALYKEVLAGMSDVDVPPALPAPARVRAATEDDPQPVEARSLAAPDDEQDDELDEAADGGDDGSAGEATLNVRQLIAQRRGPTAGQVYDGPADPVPAPDDDAPASGPAVEEGPVHRPLIRATLPRPEGQKEARPIPDFTMRQPIARGRFRGGEGRMRPRGGPGGNAHGSNGNGSGSGFGAPRPGGRRKRGR